MGYGGSLILTGVVRELKREFPKKEITIKDDIPTPLDKLTKEKFKDSYRYKKINSLLFWPRREEDLMFINNPKITKGHDLKNKRGAIILDRESKKILYVDRVTDDRVFYKDTNLHAIDIICRNYGVTAKDMQPEIYFTKEEEEKAEELTGSLGDFVAIEPNTKKSFSVNRIWIWERWQKLVDKLGKTAKIVQLGGPGSKLLQNVSNLTGIGNFRDSVAILKRAKLFIGLEGGMMHAARAVNTPSVIIWSCHSPISMTAYQENINLYHWVVCGERGLRKILCPQKCAESVTVDEVLNSALDLLQKHD